MPPDRIQRILRAETVAEVWNEDLDELYRAAPLHRDARHADLLGWIVARHLLAGGDAASFADRTGIDIEDLERVAQWPRGVPFLLTGGRGGVGFVRVEATTAAFAVEHAQRAAHDTVKVCQQVVDWFQRGQKLQHRYRVILELPRGHEHDSVSVQGKSVAVATMIAMAICDSSCVEPQSPESQMFAATGSWSGERLAPADQLEAKLLVARRLGYRRVFVVASDAIPDDSPVELLVLDPDPARAHEQLLTSVPQLAWLHARTNLVRPLTSFIGRVEALQSLMQSVEASRLVTVTGAGGCGKTRLAHEAGRRLLGRYRDGIYMAELAAVDSEAGLTPTICAAIGLRSFGQQTWVDTLIDHLRHRGVVLILDNFETILAGAGLVSRLLEACPRLRILVTSRVPLRIQGEVERPLLPLAVPPEQSSPGELLTAAEQNESLRLFFDRTEAVLPNKRWKPADRAAAAEVCRRLDGLPLAIELAAVRMGWFQSPEVLLQSLRSPTGEPRVLETLNHGLRDAPDRHQKMHRAIGWSYDLLAPSERQVLAAASIFRGGFDAQGVGYVTAALDPAIGSAESSLEVVHEASLAMVGPPTARGVRLSMLETVREFGLVVLRERGQLETAARAHAEFYKCLGVDIEKLVLGRGQNQWLRQFTVDLDNFRQAFRWAQRNGEPELAARMLNGLAVGFIFCGLTEEGMRLCDEVLPLRFALADETRGRLLAASGAMSYFVQRAEDSARWSGEALALCVEVGEWWHAAVSSTIVASCHFAVGEFEAARRTWDLGLDCAERSGDPWVMILLRATRLMDPIRTGHLEAACLGGYDDLVSARQLGEGFLVNQLTYNLALAEGQRGNLPLADSLLREGLEICEAMGYQNGVALNYDALAWIALARQELTKAEQHMATASEIRRRFELFVPPLYVPFRRMVEEGLVALKAATGSDGQTPSAP